MLIDLEAQFDDSMSHFEHLLWIDEVLVTKVQLYSNVATYSLFEKNNKAINLETLLC